MLISFFSFSSLFFCLLSPSASPPLPALSFPFSSFPFPIFLFFFLLYLKSSELGIMVSRKKETRTLILLPSPKLFSFLFFSFLKAVPGNLRPIYVCVNISAEININRRQSGLKDCRYLCHLETPCRANDPGYLQSQRLRGEWACGERAGI